MSKVCLTVMVRVIGAGGSSLARRILKIIARLLRIDLRVEEVKGETHGFDFSDESWTWDDMAKALTKRYNRVDRSELIHSLLRNDKALILEISAWEIIYGKADGK
jgi:hypothetical protein